MPATLASFSRASGRNEYLPVSKRTSDMFTIRPRAVSRVCRMALNWLQQLSSQFRFLRLRLCLVASQPDRVRPGRRPAARRSRVSDDRPRTGRQPSQRRSRVSSDRLRSARQPSGQRCPASPDPLHSEQPPSSRRSPASSGPRQPVRQPAPFPRPGNTGGVGLGRRASAFSQRLAFCASLALICQPLLTRSSLW